jgi:hypothetical protein
VVEAYLATDGKTVVQTLVGTAYTVVSLGGLIAASPSEVFTGSALGLVNDPAVGTTFYDTQASWQTGASYMKMVRQLSGNNVIVTDCLPSVATGANPTPCPGSATTLEQSFPFTDYSSGTSYQQSDGQIVMLAGVRAWVSNAPLSQNATTTYKVLYESGGQIHSAYLGKDGTTVQEFELGSTTARQDFYIVFNAAALNSIQSALSF